MIIILILVVFTFLAPNVVSNSVINTSKVFFYNVFPLLFLFFIYVDMIIESGLAKKIGVLFHHFFKRVFNIKSLESSFVIVSSFFLGNPGCAKMILKLYEDDSLDLEETRYLMCFNAYTSPIFTIFFVGETILNSYRLGVSLVLIAIFGNFLIGILFRNLFSPMVVNKIKPKNSFGLVNLSSSIQRNILTMLMILGTMIFFGIIISFIDYVGILSFFSSEVKSFVYGSIEITNGLFFLPVSANFKFALCGFFICFGGLSQHFQVFTFIKEKNVYKWFLLGRILAGFIGFILCLILINI